MGLILFYDTETTGLPDWKSPSGAEHQPHIVELAALLVDTNTRAIQQELNVIVRPDGWTIPDEVSAIHGITTDQAIAEGISEQDAVQQLLDLHAQADTRLGHIQSFDARILRIALKRYFGDEFADAWKDAPSECTAYLAKPLMALKKLPKLGEAYEFFFAEPFADAHRAMPDTRACMQVYFAAQDWAQAA